MPETASAEGLAQSQRILHALKQARSQLEAAQAAATEPIAIIGMACRFPGGADTPERFWQLLSDGRNASREIPADRWPISDYYDENPEAPGKMYVREMATLDGVDQFDPHFFGISPREAVSLDPQQRLLLELTWEAMERAGISPEKLSSSPTGVFLGIGQNDYAHFRIRRGAEADIGAYDGTGNGFCFASGRVSYIFGLQGPNLALDTACSSSLVAVHLACQSLRQRESETALAAGVHLILSPESTLFLSRSQALAPDGRSKTFDASANGYGRGEGCGVILLKRLSDAQRDNDQILATIRGSAVNHDGPSSGLTVPNGLAQQSLIRGALRNSKVDAGRVGYIETHGTGTILGDPIEMRALGEVFRGRMGSPLLAGSVKSSIGHLEAAAGMASLIKTVLMLQHREIPKQVGFQEPNPLIDWGGLPIRIPLQHSSWDCNQTTRIAGVSAFSLSGTNAHVVLEESSDTKRDTILCDLPIHVVALSAKSELALRQLATRYVDFLQSQELTLGDISYTANTGRAHFNHRLGITPASIYDLRSALKSWLGDQPSIHYRYGKNTPTQIPRIAIVFGTGVLSSRMGHELYETESSVRRIFEACDRFLQPFGVNLLSCFLSGNGERPLVSFVLEYAVATLWKSWGIEPSAAIGYGWGSILAATVAGVFSLEDGLALLAAEEAKRPGILSAIEYGNPRLRLLAQNGSVASANQLCRAEHWIEELRNESGLQPALDTLRTEGYSHFLYATCAQHPSSEDCHESLNPAYSDWFNVASTLTNLYVNGFRINWDALYASRQGRKLLLPTYPFQRQRYWINQSKRLTSPGLNSLFSRRVLSPLLRDKLFDVQCSPDSPPYLGEHRVHGAVIVPGAFHLALVLAAAKQAITGGWSLQDIGFPARLVLDGAKPRHLQFLFTPDEEHWLFTVISLASDEGSNEYTRHATGRLRANDRSPNTISIKKIQDRCSKNVEPEVLYRGLRESGIELGESFRWLVEVWSGSGEAISRLRRPAQLEGDYLVDLHPCLIDACFQSLAAVLTNQRGETYVPFGIQAAWLAPEDSFRDSDLWCHTTLQPNASPDCPLVDLSLCRSDGAVIAEITGLEVRKSQRIRDDLLSEVRWRPAPSFGQTSLTAQPGFFLIVGDPGDIGVQLARDLEERGYRAKLIRADTSIEESLEAGPVQGIVHLASLDARAESIDDDLRLVCKSVLDLVKSLTRRNAAPRLFLFTRDAQGAGNAVLNPSQAMLWGLAQVVQVEHPELRPVVIDLDTHAKVPVEIFTTEFGSDNQLALREGSLQVRRLVRVNSPRVPRTAITTEGTYLITGAFGGVGRQVARWLVNQGAKHLVLASRHADNADASRFTSELSELGASPMAVKADISVRTECESLFKTIGRVKPPLRGIIHAAGVLDDGLVVGLNWPQFRRVLEPKVAGSWNLHQLTLKQELDFFVCFSSIAALAGSPGQAAYAAGNAFQDGLMHFRHNLGLPALSVNWGPWQGEGMMERTASRTRAATKGLEPDDALRVLGDLIGGDSTQVCVANLRELIGTVPAKDLPAIVQEYGVPAPRMLMATLPPLTTSSSKLMPTFLMDYFHRQASDVLAWNQGMIDPDIGLDSFGLDSLMALEMRNRLSADLDLHLPIVKFLNGSSIRDLAEFCCKAVPEPKPEMAAIGAWVEGEL